MRHRHSPSRCARRLLLLALAALTNARAADESASVAAAPADVDQDRDEAINALPAVTVQGARDKVPSEALLGRGSPQSIVNEQVIHEIASPVGDWGTVANFTPSFVSSAPNGPGFDAAKS